jgi:hypothetical protein
MNLQKRRLGPARSSEDIPPAVLGLGTTDAIGGDIGIWAGTIVTTYVAAARSRRSLARSGGGDERDPFDERAPYGSNATHRVHFKLLPGDDPGTGSTKHEVVGCQRAAETD